MAHLRRYRHLVHSPDDLSFDAATASELGPDGTTFSTTVHELWTVGDKPNGGYLLALLGRAARQMGNDSGAHTWEVVSSAITYLRPPALGAAEIHTTVLRRGRTAAHVRAVLVQGGTDLVEATFVLSELPPDPVVARYDDVAPLLAPGPEDCVQLPPRMPGGVKVGIMEVLDLRLDPAALPYADAAPVGDVARAELRGHTRFADGRAPDALSLLFFSDAIPPATAMIGSSGWVPTLQMSAYVRARPGPGWLGIRLTANLVAAGMVDETCTLWDSAGHVVAQATQLARLRFPDEQ
jgi:acyl-coenzyme A thioesterase PaaI-like protein